MNIIRNSLVSSIIYLSEAVVRVFSPSDDNYPVIGLQPYSGEPYLDNALLNW